MKNWFGCKKINRAIIHCDKYIPYPLFVTKVKPTHKENHVDDLKTMEDYDTFSICTNKNFEKRAEFGNPMSGLKQVYDEHLPFIEI